MITIYTDGSSKGNPGPGGYGAVVSFKKLVDSKQKDWVIELGGREEHTTNNRMELTAAIEALKFIDSSMTPPPTPSPYQGEGERGRGVSIELHTDSEYVMKGITLWIGNWQKNNWRTAAKKPLLNQDLWQKLLEETAGKEIKWQYVAGHSGHAANERCDMIATSFADLPAGRQVAPLKLYDGPRESYPISL